MDIKFEKMARGWATIFYNFENADATSDLAKNCVIEILESGQMGYFLP